MSAIVSKPDTDAPQPPFAPEAKAATREDLARMFKLRYPPLPPTRLEDAAAAPAPTLLQSLQQSGMMPPLLPIPMPPAPQ